MANLRPFQIILLAIFLALAVGGLIFFALFRGFGSEPNPYGTRVDIWGTLDARAFEQVRNALVESDDQFSVVAYTQKDARSFRSELVNAIAEGRGPDAVVLPHDLLLAERAKLYPIPYETLSERTIRDTYIDGAEIFSLSEGTYGFPIAVDPLVMYWNRDLFSSAGLATPPATWLALTNTTVPALTVISNDTFSVVRASLAFGEYANVTNATKILLMLALQAGSGLIAETDRGFEVRLNRAVEQTARPPLLAALDFYTQFANPSRPIYTWNRSLPQDRAEFLAGDLALYFGIGSEYAGLVAGNPNLNFDAAPVPQGGGATIQKGYGTFYALTPLRSSDNLAGTFYALQQLGSAESAQALAQGLGIAPVHRAVLAQGAANPFRQTMYRAALVSRGFLNPSPEATEGIIKTMVEDVTSGRMAVSEAVSDAVTRFNQLIR